MSTNLMKKPYSVQNYRLLLVSSFHLERIWSLKKPGFWDVRNIKLWQKFIQQLFFQWCISMLNITCSLPLRCR